DGVVAKRRPQPRSHFLFRFNGPRLHALFTVTRLRGHGAPLPRRSACRARTTSAARRPKNPGTTTPTWSARSTAAQTLPQSGFPTADSRSPPQSHGIPPAHPGTSPPTPDSQSHEPTTHSLPHIATAPPLSTPPHAPPVLHDPT